MPEPNGGEALDSQQRLRAIYDGTPEYIGFNQAALAFGPSALEDVVGLPFWETVWWVYTPGAPAQLREVIARAGAGRGANRPRRVRRADSRRPLQHDVLRTDRPGGGPRHLLRILSLTGPATC